MVSLSIKRASELLVAILVFLSPALVTAQTAWNISTVDSTGDVGQYSNIAISGDELFIGSYKGGTNKDIRYAKKSLSDAAASFTLGTFLSAGDSGQYLSMDVFGGDLYFTFVREGATLRYLKRSPPFSSEFDAFWTLDTSDTGLWSSIKVDQNSRAHITYRNWGGSGSPCPEYSGAAGDGLLFHKWSGSNDTDIQCSQITTGAIAGPHSLAIDSNNIPHVIYTFSRGTTAVLKYKKATFVPGAPGDPSDDSYTWSGGTEVVNITGATDETEAANWAGQLYNSLAVDPAGNLNIAFYNPKDKRLQYRRYESTWRSTETIDYGTDSHDVGKFLDLSLGPDNTPHVSYYDATDKTLKYAKRIVRGYIREWDEFIVDGGAGRDVGQYSSIVIDTTGVAHVSYYDATPDALDLKYANNTGACGNGAVEGEEECDDGNSYNLDGCDTTCHREPATDLSISVSDSPDPVDPGGQLTLTITVTNEGPDSVSSTLSSAGMVRVTTPIGWACLLPAGCGAEVLFPIPPLAASSTATFIVVAQAPTTTSSTASYTTSYLVRISPTVYDPIQSNNVQPVLTTVSEGSSLEICGNSVPGLGEQCDDGNLNQTDGCLNNCQSARCGDGWVQADVEICDDGNDLNTDGCVSCQLARCGDGFVDAEFEECDDANTENTDACISCQTARCGDAFVQVDVETCDDGDSNDTNSCRNDCTAPAVGGGGNTGGMPPPSSDPTVVVPPPDPGTIAVPIRINAAGSGGCSLIID